ncbi:MAG: hypothetical protein IPL08_08225 [Saprospiraceae bacterium]|jgi:hypothetical protein|nr:hypothetical protein [Saprospiraceae bacterium]MBK8670395.1 hypothetical protein [Saprospiraceae bacterium]
MRRSVIIAVFLIVSTFLSGYSQANRAVADGRRIERNDIRKAGGPCKKMKKRHIRSMKRMALADGKVTPREKRMLRKERRRVF